MKKVLIILVFLQTSILFGQNNKTLHFYYGEVNAFNINEMRDYGFGNWYLDHFELGCKKGFVVDSKYPEFKLVTGMSWIRNNSSDQFKYWDTNILSISLGFNVVENGLSLSPAISYNYGFDDAQWGFNIYFGTDIFSDYSVGIEYKALNVCSKAFGSDSYNNHELQGMYTIIFGRAF